MARLKVNMIADLPRFRGAGRRSLRKAGAALVFALGLAVAATTWIGVAVAQGDSGLSSALKDHDTSQPVDITADGLEVRESEGIAIFQGSVEARQGDLIIYSDSATVHYSAEVGGSSPSVSRLDVIGGVRLVSPSESAAADWVIYDMRKKLITLGGNVELTRGDNVMRSERLELDLSGGSIRFGGGIGADEAPTRVEGRFTITDIQKD